MTDLLRGTHPGNSQLRDGCPQEPTSAFHFIGLSKKVDKTKRSPVMVRTSEVD